MQKNLKLFSWIWTYIMWSLKPRLLPWDNGKDEIQNHRYFFFFFFFFFSENALIQNSRKMSHSSGIQVSEELFFFFFVLFCFVLFFVFLFFCFFCLFCFFFCCFFLICYSMKTVLQPKCGEKHIKENLMAITYDFTILPFSPKQICMSSNLRQNAAVIFFIDRQNHPNKIISTIFPFYSNKMQIKTLRFKM